MCSMLKVIFIDGFVFLLMILFVDVGSSCTAEDVVELVEMLDLAVVVLSVPMGFEEGAPVGCGAIHGLQAVARDGADGRSVSCAGRAPLFCVSMP